MNQGTGYIGGSFSLLSDQRPAQQVEHECIPLNIDQLINSS